MKRTKWSRFLSMLLGIAIVAACFMPVAAPSTVHAAGPVYYVDSVGGDDMNAGTSSGSAWKTLSKVNGTVFQPGDKILFKADGVWTGTLSPQGSGTEGNPITIDMYGTGRKPLIAGAGAPSAVYFYNQEQWEVRNLEITNNAATADVRRGIHLDGSSGTWTNPKVYKHFLFENLEIHNVKGKVSTDYAHNGGIIVWGTKWDYHVSDVVINNCKIYSLDSVGIYLNGAQTKYSTGLKVTNNLIYDVAADGAFVLNTTNGLIENNIVHDSHVRASGYHVPLWVFASKNSVIQNNEVYNTAPGGDAMAYDADYKSDGTIIQYNYSHNNAGGGFLVVNDGTVASNSNTNTTIRYNISQNDSGAVFNFSGTPDTTYVYNNTVYLPKYSNAKVVDYTNWGGYAKNTYFYNNIINNLGSGGYNFASSTNNVFEHNLFFGNHPANEPADPFKITEDPQLASPGSGGIGKDTVIGYQLLSTSPAIGAGKLISNNGGRDYFGNPVSSTNAPNIGAYQGPGLDPNNLPPLPQPPIEENLLKNPGFETGDFTNWPIHYNGATIVNNNANTGTYAAKLTGSTAGVEQTVSGLHPNTIYKLYANGKSVGGGDAVFGVKNYGGSSKDVHMSSTSYSRKEITFTTGSSNTSAIIYLYKGGGSGDVYFDDLELIQYSASPGGSTEPPPVFTEGSDDEFNVTDLNSQWHWVRENPAKWSLSTSPGYMSIVSENGDIAGGSADAKNILITGSPEEEENWAIETKLDGKPTSRWSQGGLAVYVNDDTYIRMTRLYGSGNQFQFDLKINGVRNHMEVPDTIESTVSYLRIVKYGNTYAGYYSADGVTYTQVGTTQTADLVDPKIGLIVCAGTGLTANFDYFHIVTDGITPPPPPPPVAVSGVALNTSALSLKVDETVTLSAAVSPSNAANKEVIWSSNNPAVAQVDANGNVTAVGVGTASITVTTVDGSKTAVCTVQVVSVINLLTNPGFETGDFTGWPTHFTQSAIVNMNAHTGTYAARLSTAYGGIEQKVNGLTPNTTYTLSAWAKGVNGEFGVKNYGSYQRQVYVNSTEYKKSEITFTTGSTNTSATILMYKRAAAGEVFFDDFELVQKSQSIVPVTGVTLDKSELSINIGETASLSAAVSPLGATNKAVTWSSDNPAVVQVNGNGTITAAGAGTATVTVTTADGAKTAVCTVQVLPVLEQVIVSPSVSVLTIGNTAALAISALMSDGTTADLSQSQIVYSSSNEQVAVLDNGGIVRATGEGTATIKAAVTLRGISKEGSMSITVDETPPTTTASTQMPDSNGWYNSDITVTLSAQDHLSGISKTEFRVGSEGAWNDYSAPISLTNEGTFIVQYRSVDHAGNTEEMKQNSFSIDQTPAAFTLSTDDGRPLLAGGSFDIGEPLTFQASDALSGVASAKLTVTGVTYSIDLQASSAIDIDFTGRSGSYTATIFLEDVAGNTFETEFAFSVTVSIDSIRNLIVGYLGSSNTPGALFNNLDQAQHHLDMGRKDQAAKHLQDFIKHLDNAALGANVSENEKEILQANTAALIRMW